MEETADSSEPGAILEPSNKNENSGKVTPPSDIKQNSKANKNKRNSNYMAFLLLGSNDDFFSAVSVQMSLLYKPVFFIMMTKTSLGIIKVCV